MGGNIPHAGDWTVGDTLKTIEYEALRGDGTPFNLTGHTVKLQGRSTASRGNKIDADASVPSPASGVIVFPLGTVLVLGATQARETYELQFKITRTADAFITYTDKFTAAVVRASL